MEAAASDEKAAFSRLSSFVHPNSNEAETVRYFELGEFVLQSIKQKEVKLQSDNVKEIIYLLSAIKIAAKCVTQILRKSSTYSVKESNDTLKQFSTAELAQMHFVSALVNRGVVAGIASQFLDSFQPCDKDKEMVILINPLDGIHHIDFNVSVGSLFSIYKRVSPVGSAVTEEDFLQAGSKQLCAGYLIYGSSTMLVYTMGRGVHGFTVDPITGTFYLTHKNIEMPRAGSVYSVNSGKYNRFPYGVRAYIDDCHKKKLSCRHIGSLVADFHRNMIKGGIFIYPPTFIDPKPSVSLVYQCFPLAFLTEQSGGIASDGFTRVLDIKPYHFDDRLPFFCGSMDMVSQLQTFMAENKMKDGGWCFNNTESATAQQTDS